MSELKAYKPYANRDGDVLIYHKGDGDLMLDDEDEIYLKEDADKVIAHHKHKRCLAMAEICRHEWCVLYYERKKYRENPFLDHLKERKNRHREKWLELAEKFKEGK